jgi:hypothetical protein
MRVFMVKAFVRFVRRERIRERALCEVVARIGKGLVDADLGGGLIKQRIAREGQGRSGGFRALIAIRHGRRVVFLYGFAKSERGNIGAARLAELKLYASRWLGLDDARIAQAIAGGDLLEVVCEQETEEIQSS